MTTHINNYLIPDAILDKAVDLACRRNKRGALESLRSCGLSNEQVAAIKNTLNAFVPNHSTPQQQRLKDRIFAVLNGYLCFPNAKTSVFSNAYPCQFKFRGKYYQNAALCFLAQQYTNEPEIMDIFTICGTEKDLRLAIVNPEGRNLLREKRDSKHIDKDDVLMHIQRAKFKKNPKLFRQYPELKEHLLATGSAYLVCQSYDMHLGDNINGTGQNALGECLMRLRAEYGGTGVVPPHANYLSAMQSLQTRCHLMTNELIDELIKNIFLKCESKSIGALACVNKHYNACWEKFDLKQLCPNLTILDAKTRGIKVYDEPLISKLTLFRHYQDLAPCVENNEGLTLLTMTKGVTLNHLVAIAAEKGITVNFGYQILQKLGDVPVEQTYVILITNNVFMESRNKCYTLQKNLVAGHGCEMPTVQEYVALCVFTNMCFQKCLYGQDPLTSGLSSSLVGGSPLVVGGSSPGRLCVSFLGLANGSYGAGGRRKL